MNTNSKEPSSSAREKLFWKLFCDLKDERDRQDLSLCIPDTGLCNVAHLSLPMERDTFQSKSCKRSLAQAHFLVGERRRGLEVI